MLELLLVKNCYFSLTKIYLLTEKQKNFIKRALEIYKNLS
jgi:hypothetical protein